MGMKTVLKCKQEVDDGMTYPATPTVNLYVKRNWVRIYIFDKFPLDIETIEAVHLNINISCIL